MTHTQTAAMHVTAQLPPDVVRGGALDGLIAEIVAELVKWLKGKCYPTPEAAYAYLTREYWLDPWGWREARRLATINGAIDEVIGKRPWADQRIMDQTAKAVRTALAANLTLPLMQGLYSESD